MKALVIGAVLVACGCWPAAAQRHDPYIPPPTHLWPRVEIVCIDDASIQHIGRWPFDRKLHASLVDKLVAAGARAIAFDLFFGGPLSLDGDREFARAIARSNRTWLIVDPTTAQNDVPDPPLTLLARAARWRVGVPFLPQTMHFSEGVPIKPFGRSRLPHLLVGLMADYLHLRRWPSIEEGTENTVFGSWVLPTPGSKFTADHSDPRRLAINADSRLHLHSYWKVIDGGYPMSRFRDAIVFVGFTPGMRNGEELIFEDWNIPRWVLKSHVESLGILMEKMIRYLDHASGARR